MTQAEVLSQLQKLEEFDQNAHAYVYVLSGYRNSDHKQFFYVGETRKRPEVRIAVHFGDSTSMTTPTPTKHGEALISKSAANREKFEVATFKAKEIVRVKSMWRRDSESLLEFGGRVKNQERITFLETAMKHKTSRVLGGR
jgi:hypothetical protein